MELEFVMWGVLDCYCYVLLCDVFCVFKFWCEVIDYGICKFVKSLFGVNCFI